MYGDNGLLINLDAFRVAVDGAGVLVTGFSHFPDRLLVDARSNEEEGPLVQVVDPAGSIQERLAWLMRRRPSLGATQSLKVLSWPHSIDFLVQSALWEHVCRRVSADIEPEVRLQCDLALKQLQNLELSANQEMLKGKDCFTLWRREEVKEGRA
jgi:hypothetical protein